MGDFFADLLPKEVPQNSSQQPPTFEDDVLVSPKAGSESAATRSSNTPPMAGHPMVSTTSGLDVRDRAARHYSTRPNPPIPTPLPLQRKDSSKDLEGAVQQVFQKFSGSLQKILEDIDRCGGGGGGAGGRQCASRALPSCSLASPLPLADHHTPPPPLSGPAGGWRAWRTAQSRLPRL